MKNPELVRDFFYIYVKFLTMKKLLISFLSCLFFMSCNKEKEKVNVPYIISEIEKQTKQVTNKNEFPPPPPVPGWLTYGTNTFIIDQDLKIYYFQRNKVGFVCGNGSQNDTIPYFIDLQPKDLIEIPNNCIADFVKLNYKKEVRNLTFISSQLDTLKSKNYFDLIKAIETSCQDRDNYRIGRTTQEEDTVLKYKKNNDSYSSDLIKWDKTKIIFDKN
jgi:hypothetical protein